LLQQRKLFTSPARIPKFLQNRPDNAKKQPGILATVPLQWALAPRKLRATPITAWSTEVRVDRVYRYREAPHSI